MSWDAHGTCLPTTRQTYLNPVMERAVLRCAYTHLHLYCRPTNSYIFQPMGVYGGSTFHQGEGATPAPHDAPSSSNCKTSSTIGNTFSISGTRVVTSVSATTTRTVSDHSYHCHLSHRSSLGLLPIDHYWFQGNERRRRHWSVKH